MCEQQQLYRVEDNMTDTLWEREGRRMRRERYIRNAKIVCCVVIAVGVMLVLIWLRMV
jgi:hypothetical protein